jgi:hypothetical protein
LNEKDRERFIGAERYRKEEPGFLTRPRDERVKVFIAACVHIASQFV